MGPFPSSRGNKYILVAVDYLLKWVMKQKRSPPMKPELFANFLNLSSPDLGPLVPSSVIAVPIFATTSLQRSCLNTILLTVSLPRITPKTSGQVEVSNRGLKRILERIVGKNRVSWSDKLDDAL
ncbi:reverse transcriptase domain-containing protein [Tanacetum coccineum]